MVREGGECVWTEPVQLLRRYIDQCLSPVYATLPKYVTCSECCFWSLWRQLTASCLARSAALAAAAALSRSSASSLVRLAVARARFSAWSRSCSCVRFHRGVTISIKKFDSSCYRDHQHTSVLWYRDIRGCTGWMLHKRCSPTTYPAHNIACAVHHGRRPGIGAWDSSVPTRRKSCPRRFFRK